MSEDEAKRAVLMKEDLGSQLYSARVKKLMSEQGISQKEAEAIVTQQRIDEDPFYFHKVLNRIDAEKLEFERKNINPELKGREKEEVKAVEINRFFADRTKGSDITDEEVIAKLDETVTRNENGVRVLQNDNGETATLSNGSIKEMLSVGKTDDNIGGIVNKEAIANLPALFKTAIKVKETEDLRHNRDNRIVRYANVFESNGESIMVKITVKSFDNNHRQLTDIEFENNGKRDLSAYSLKTAKKNTVADDLRASPADKSYGNNNDVNISIDDLIDFVNTYTSKEINIDGVKRSTRNSDGSRIAKTEEGLRAFYKWFGDSDVVDEQGRPLVVWHTTDAEFRSFDPEKIGGGGAGAYHGYG